MQQANQTELIKTWIIILWKLWLVADIKLKFSFFSRAFPVCLLSYTSFYFFTAFIDFGFVFWFVLWGLFVLTSIERVAARLMEGRWSPFILEFRVRKLFLFFRQQIFFHSYFVRKPISCFQRLILGTQELQRISQLALQLLFHLCSLRFPSCNALQLTLLHMIWYAGICSGHSVTLFMQYYGLICLNCNCTGRNFA